MSVFISDIVRVIVEGLQKDLTPLTSVENNGLWEVTFSESCLWFAQYNYYQTANGKVKLEKIENDVYFFKKDPGAFVTLPINYYQGRHIPTNIELSKQKKEEKKFPLVYLHEIIKERRNRNHNSLIDREATLRMFFLSNININDWKTSDHYDYAIDPMNNMLETFVDELESSANIHDVGEYDVIPYAQFGNLDKEGSIKWIFDNAPCSGVELIINLPIRRRKVCRSKN